MQAMKEFILRYRWRLLCVALGLLLAILWLSIGFWGTLLLAVCIGIGYVVGISIETKNRLYQWVADFFSKR